MDKGRDEMEHGGHGPGCECAECAVETDRPEQRFNQAPTGHKIPLGRSPDDPAMEFTVPDCGVTPAWGDHKEGEEDDLPFSHPIGK